MKSIFFLLVIVSVCLFPFSSHREADAIGRQVTRAELLETATNVANFIEEYRRLPETADEYVNVGLETLSTSQFLYLMAVCIRDIDQNLSIETYSAPDCLDPSDPYPALNTLFDEDLYKAPLSKDTYMRFVKKVIWVLRSNVTAPDYFTFRRAQVRYCTAVHYFACILRFYDFFGLLPQSMDVKVISPRNLLPDSWDAPGEVEEHTSAVTYHCNNSDDHLYYCYSVIDYGTFRLAKELIGDLPLYDALESIFDWVKYETWLEGGYASIAHAPFGYGCRSAREAWSMRVATSGSHEVKMSALYRSIGIPAYRYYVYYNPEERWINSDVHRPFGTDPKVDQYGEMYEGYEDSPLPSKDHDFIHEIQYIVDYAGSNQDMGFRGLFINASDVLTYGAEPIVQKAKRGGFNALILTVKTPYGDLYCDPGVPLPEEISARIREDALGLLLPAARAENMEVHAGVTVLSDYMTSGEHEDWCQWCEYDCDEPDSRIGMICPCVPEYRELLQTILEGMLAGYPVDGVVFTDLRWSKWGSIDRAQMGDNRYCELYYDTGEEGWHEQALIDYLAALADTVRAADGDCHISFLSASMARANGTEDHLDARSRYCGQNFYQLSQLVDNFIINVGGHYWLSGDDEEDFFDQDHEFRYDFEKLIDDLTSQTETSVSVAINLRDEWEYPPEFFKGLYKYCSDRGVEGFHLYSMVSGWGEWGPAFTESQWDKVQYIGLKTAAP